MTISSKTLVELVLLGPAGDRRQLQDSPILGDVWLAYGAKPNQKQDLLITPQWKHPAGEVASLLAERLGNDNDAVEEPEEHESPGGSGSDVACLHGLIAVRIGLRDLLRQIVPLTVWWKEREVDGLLENYIGRLWERPAKEESESPKDPGIYGILESIRFWAETCDNLQASDERVEKETEKCMRRMAKISALDRYVALAGLILWAGGEMDREQVRKAPKGAASRRKERPKRGLQLLSKLKKVDQILVIVESLLREILADRMKEIAAANSGVPMAGGGVAATLEKAAAELLARASAGLPAAETSGLSKAAAMLVDSAIEQPSEDRFVSILTDAARSLLTSGDSDELRSAAGRLLAIARDGPVPGGCDHLDAQPIYQVSLNRKALPALIRSVPSVKGDAARTVFKVNCSNIGWAVLDSGIQANHPAFVRKNQNGTDVIDKNGKLKSRVVKAYDFAFIRKIVAVENRVPGRLARNLEILKKKSKLPFFTSEFDEEAVRLELETLANEAAEGRPTNWRVVEKYITLDQGREPHGNHGTHVAGIIGAGPTSVHEGEGMCPDIQLYDFRVLSDEKNTEFSIIAALQFIQYLNSRQSYVKIHGANLSLSIPHDVRNFACGRTPICVECTRLVDSGVVVVAAAGNLGYHSFETKDGFYDGYAAFSITDPGNADDVITVGATHRYWPHTFGVSFFSSRGPTGDGRIKPDIVAPGERIRSCLAEGGKQWGELDGTSMAAPHVSGAAAMLLARYSELVGQPRKIKRILCESATDLGRERTFQGHGMLDVLRAFQKI